MLFETEKKKQQRNVYEMDSKNRFFLFSLYENENEN